MSETPAEAEATAEAVDFKALGKTWTVPSRVLLSHKRRMWTAFERYGDEDYAMAVGFLDIEQLGALHEMDPDEKQLDEFGTALAKALGFKTSGNS